MTKTSNVVAYVGLNYYGAREWSQSVALRVIADTFAREQIDGMTVSKCVGLWRGEIENSLRVELLDVDASAVRRALETIARELLQFEVIYTVDGMTERVSYDATADRLKRLA